MLDVYVAGGKFMIRTQVYLTERERIGLQKAAHDTGKKQSELIRDAVDLFLEQTTSVWRENILKEAAGIWQDHTELPDFESERRSWDRD
jgi:hypothetical protein